MTILNDEANKETRHDDGEPAFPMLVADYGPNTWTIYTVGALGLGRLALKSKDANRTEPTPGWPDGFTPSVSSTGGCDLHPEAAKEAE